MINQLISKQLLGIVQKRCFQFSKINRFLEQLSKEDEFYFAPGKSDELKNKFNNLMKTMAESRSYSFNYQLQEHLQNQEINSEQLVSILQSLQQNSLSCSYANKSLLLKMMKKEIDILNQKTTNIIQNGFSLGINDTEILNQYLAQFEITQLDRFPLVTLFDILFVVSQAATNSKTIELTKKFKEQWFLLISLLKMSLQQSQNFYVKKYPHLAFIMKGVWKDTNVAKKKFLLEDLEVLFLKITAKFKEDQGIKYLESKEFTILFSSINFLTLHIESQDLKALVDQMIIFVLDSDFSRYNDLSLQSLALSFSYLPSFQSQITPLLINQMRENQDKFKYNIKSYLSILFEIIFKWRQQVDRGILYDLMYNMRVSDQSDFDLAQYFQIITILSPKDLMLIIIRIENELQRRRDRNEKLDHYRPDITSIQRIKKSLIKIQARLKLIEQGEKELVLKLISKYTDMFS